MSFACGICFVSYIAFFRKIFVFRQNKVNSVLLSYWYASIKNKNSAKLKKEIKSTMAKINHFVMGTKVMALDNIEVKKGFLGLSTKLIYKPTNSEVKIKENEYSAEDGKKLETILASKPEDMADAISKHPVSVKELGNARLEACVSSDRQFAAAMLLSFKDLSYTPVTDLRVYEGKAAEAFAKLFKL